jgi:hypothetical protein
MKTAVQMEGTEKAGRLEVDLANASRRDNVGNALQKSDHPIAGRNNQIGRIEIRETGKRVGRCNNGPDRGGGIQFIQESRGYLCVRLAERVRGDEEVRSSYRKGKIVGSVAAKRRHTRLN